MAGANVPGIGAATSLENASVPGDPSIEAEIVRLAGTAA